MISRTRLLGSGCVLTLSLTIAGAAGAADQGQSLPVGDGTLVRGGAPLPEYHLNFLGDDAGSRVLLPGGAANDLEIALTSPNSGVFHFLFSPRPQFGFGYDRATATNRGFAGLTWSLFDSDRLFGSIGLAGSYDAGSVYDPLHRAFGPPLLMHGAVEFGYQLGEQHSLSLRVDDGHSPDLRFNNAENSNDFLLRYGLKF